MSSYSRLLYQIVFSTKYRQKTLKKENRQQLYKYMWGVLNNNKCIVYAINGVEDHIHIITHIHPSTSISSLVKDIKVSSSIWIKKNKLFPSFISWQVGYSVFSYSIEAKDNLINYVDNQEAHHKKKNSREELIELLDKFEIEYEEKYVL
jgi:REP element-mobilizing transposase RayT